MILLMDANVKLGSLVSEAVGSWQQDEENYNGSRLHEIAQLERLLLPATFEEYHSGNGYTWTQAVKKAGGEVRRHRIDYIGIPRSWVGEGTRSQTDYDFDHLNEAEDHELIEAWVNFQHAHRPKKEEATHQV